ncbi:kelch domain-containing protein [Sarcoptes scabiei]|uniref:Kelch domain-containing protein n=1 Tax=Sarcoptes scabiei TaxID=52283 RepID=A0A132A824_SARSC|nr:kelch domain-containing protein [Sarcoptes scabiei]
MPIERSSACATIIENFLYLFGGFSEEGNLNTLNRLNLSTLKWSRLRPNGREPLPCDKNIGWEFDGNFYLFGGYGPVPRIWSEDFPFQFIFDNSSHWHYVRGWNNQLVYYDREMNCWQWPNHHGDIPSARAACAAAKIGHLLYLFGGRVNQDRMNDMYVLNLRSYRWKQIQCNDLDYPISGRSWHTLTQTSERFLILYGGFSHNNQPLNDCWLFDIQTNVWREIILPTRKPRFWHTATLSSFNEILILGGAIEELNVTFHRNPKYNVSFEEKKNHIFAKNIFTIQLEPKSLFRQCLNVIANSLPLTENLINSLPRCLIEIVLKRCLTNTNLNRLCYLLNHNSFALSLNVSK